MTARLPMFPATLLVLACVATLFSFIGALDLLTWFLEAAPVLIGAPVLALTWRRFALTPLLYTLIFLHALILLYGAHYTYAETPLGFWMRDSFGFSRNPYDRVGHFAQGFMPAVLAREILIRNRAINGRGWLLLCVTAICLAFSACYEFFEWWASVSQGAAADAFLGSQGDIWDTQWDMFMALIGALCAQLALSRLHDRQLAKSGPGRRGDLADAHREPAPLNGEA